MITVAACLWDANQNSHEFSRVYDETWVRKLYWGFKRNLTRPWRFVLFTDRKRELPAAIGQELLATAEPDYGCYTEPYRMNVPMILVGLDTVVLRNVDHLADHAEMAERIALPRDPYAPWRACNGVAVVPRGQLRVADEWRGENDMEWIRRWPHDFLDELFPGHVGSYKGMVVPRGLGNARIVYFHGAPKMHEVAEPWVAEHWREGA